MRYPDCWDGGGKPLSFLSNDGDDADGGVAGDIHRIVVFRRRNDEGVVPIFDCLKDTDLEMAVGGLVARRSTPRRIQVCLDSDVYPLPNVLAGIDDYKREILKHNKRAPFIWDVEKLSLLIWPKAEFVENISLSEKLKDFPLANACMAEFLLQSPHLIPEAWCMEGLTVLFCGTEFRGGYIAIRYSNRLWGKCDVWKGSHYNPDSMAILLIED